jgi:DNA invertase Pin-like site-specific DNA recombinase
MSGRGHEKITPHHHEHAAYVSVRQSTLKQVHQHHEGRQNPYALVQCALDLGWPPERVRVIDADVDQSGQDSQRPGFQELVAAVSLGRVGIILAYEASRLARNNADWYTLIDLATVVGTLLADTERLFEKFRLP